MSTQDLIRSNFGCILLSPTLAMGPITVPARPPRPILPRTSSSLNPVSRSITIFSPTDTGSERKSVGCRLESNVSSASSNVCVTSFSSENYSQRCSQPQQTVRIIPVTVSSGQAHSTVRSSADSTAAWSDAHVSSFTSDQEMHNSFPSSGFDDIFNEAAPTTTFASEVRRRILQPVRQKRKGPSLVQRRAKKLVVEPVSEVHEIFGTDDPAPAGIADTQRDGDDSDIEASMDLEELEKFAKRFKARRLEMGFTQGDVGMALGRLYGNDFSQTTVSRFEALNLSFKNMCKLKPLLQKWLKDAEQQPRDSLQFKKAFSMQAAEEETRARRRKKRTSIEGAIRTELECCFSDNPKPSYEEMDDLAAQLGLDPEVVKVWFCNRRQKSKKVQCTTESGGLDTVGLLLCTSAPPALPVFQSVPGDPSCSSIS